MAVLLLLEWPPAMIGGGAWWHQKGKYFPRWQGGTRGSKNITFFCLNLEFSSHESRLSHMAVLNPSWQPAMRMHI